MSNIINQIEQAQMRSDLPPFSQGDNVIVWVKVKEGTRDRLQAFEGLVIARKSRGLNSSFTVRKMSHGEGVERVFQDHSPIISHVEVTRYGKVRQAKLYYLRELSGRAARIKENLSKAKKYSELNKQQAAKSAEAAKAAKAADSAE